MPKSLLISASLMCGVLVVDSGATVTASVFVPY